MLLAISQNKIYDTLSTLSFARIKAIAETHLSQLGIIQLLCMQDTQQVIQNFIFSDVVQKFAACKDTETFVCSLYEEYKKFIQINVSTPQIQELYLTQMGLKPEMINVIIKLFKYFLIEVNLFYYHILLGYIIVQRSIIVNGQYANEALEKDNLVLNILYIYILLVNQNIADVTSVVADMKSIFVIDLQQNISPESYVDLINDYEINSQLFQSYPMFWMKQEKDKLIISSIQSILQQQPQLVHNLLYQKDNVTQIKNNQLLNDFSDDINCEIYLSESDCDMQDIETPLLEQQNLQNTFQMASQFINSYKGKIDNVIYTLCLSHILCKPQDQLITLQELILLFQESGIEEIYQYIIMYELCKYYSMHNMKDVQHYVEEFEAQLDYIKSLDQTTKWCEYMILQLKKSDNSDAKVEIQLSASQQAHYHDKIQTFVNNMKNSLQQQLDIKSFSLQLLRQEMLEIQLDQEGIKRQEKLLSDQSCINQRDVKAFMQNKPFLARRFIKQTLYDIENYELNVYGPEEFMSNIAPDLQYSYDQIEQLFSNLLKQQDIQTNNE